MNRTQKTEFIQEMSDALNASPHVILASFSGLTVNDATALRRKVRAAGGTYRVVKNRLLKRAVEGTGAEVLKDRLNGPCALAYHPEDPVGLAKALTEFAKDNPGLEVLAGVVDAKEMLDATGVEALAKLPGLPELRAQLLALINTPATTVVRLLNTPGGQLARVIDANREKQGGATE